MAAAVAGAHSLAPPVRLARPRVLVGPVVVAALAVAVRLLYGGGVAGYDATYGLLWGRDLIHGQVPDFESPLAPTPHPLANLVSAPISLLGDRALYVIPAIALVALAAAAWFAFRIGASLFTPAIGIVFAVIVLTRRGFLESAQGGQVDMPFLALVLAAGAVAAADARRWQPILGLLAFAGLLRPEAWLLSFAYLAWIVRTLDARGRRNAAALALAAPVAWALFDLLVTGDPLYSLHGTRELAVQLGRPRGIGAALSALPNDIGMYLTWQVEWVGVGGLILALRLLGRPVRVPAAVILIGVAGFLVLAVAGLPVLARYLLVPETMLAMFAAVGLLGWRALPSGRERRVWQLWAAVALVGLVIAMPRAASSLADAHEKLADQRGVVADLHHLVDAPAASGAVARCAALSAPEYRAVPLLAYWLDRRASEIGAGTPRAQGGVAFVGYTSRSVAMQLSQIPRAVAVPAGTPAGLHVAYRNRSWLVYEQC